MQREFAIIKCLFVRPALREELDGKKDVVVFDFLGKDSIRYYNSVPVSIVACATEALVLSVLVNVL